MLDNLMVEGLHEVARQYGMEASGVRANLIDRIIDHFEKTGWPEQIRVTASHSIINSMASASVLSQTNSGNRENITDLNRTTLRQQASPETVSLAQQN